MRKLLCIVMGLLLIIITGCSKVATDDEKVAEEYIKTHG